MTEFSPWLGGHVEMLSLWIGALCTLGLYSILYKENKVYRLFEHMFLGLSAGYLIAKTWTDVLLPKWWKPFYDDGQWWQIFLLAAGLLYYFIYSRKHSWMARLLIAVFLGTSAGQIFKAFVNDTWPQIPASFKPVVPHGPIAGHPEIAPLSVSGAINNLLFMFILVCVMSYFFFSFEQKHPVLKRSAQWGRWLMMFAFGATFGSTMMARMALLIGRTDYLMNYFGPQIGGARVMFGFMLALIAVMLYLTSRFKETAEGPDGS